MRVLFVRVCVASKVATIEVLTEIVTPFDPLNVVPPAPVRPAPIVRSAPVV